MANPATSDDLVARSLRTLTDQEITVGGTLLGDAWNVIVSRVPEAENRLSNTTFSDLVVQIECAMVLRVLNNPDGKRSETIDDYQYQLDQAVSTGALYLSDAEYGLLTAGDSTSDTAFTIKPSGWGRQDGFWVTPDWWQAT
jgi:hypothetical protein